KVKTVFSPRVRQWIGTTAIASLLIVMLFVSAKLHEGIKVGLIVALVSTLLLCQPNLRIFRIRSSFFMGQISYSWYLWHWPLIVVTTYFGVVGDWRVKTGVFFLSLLLGWISWYYLETKRNSFKLRSVIVAYTFTILVTFVGTKIEL